MREAFDSISGDDIGRLEFVTKAITESVLEDEISPLQDGEFHIGLFSSMKNPIICGVISACVSVFDELNQTLQLPMSLFINDNYDDIVTTLKNYEYISFAKAFTDHFSVASKLSR